MSNAILLERPRFTGGASVNQEPHPAESEQHLLIFDIAEESTVPDLPVNFNRYMTGAITFDIVGSERSMMTLLSWGVLSSSA